MRVLLTGASRGIGKATCLRLADGGLMDAVHGLIAGRPATERKQ